MSVILESAVPVLLASKTKPSAHFDEVDVQTLVASTIFAKPIAPQVFKVDSPTFFPRRIGCEVMLGARLSFADPSDVLPDVSRQMIYVVGIPRVILVYGAPLGKGWQFIAKH